MRNDILILFSRENCCLCKDLEEKFSQISIDSIKPGLKYVVQDIDSRTIPKFIKKKYSLEVPILLLVIEQGSKRIELPRVNPKLMGQDLFEWLQKVISERI